mmetsp:Transcript_29328/g.113652  ORF Transcript_29328/g.113652 Transcript_29328/m.113652 type:complete len:294 (-) Transcript_29328:693-1574(-)
MRVSRVLRTYTAPASSHDYCLNLVREVDYDQFMLNLMQPQSIRLAHSAMRAFNVELGKAAIVSSKPQIGEMRLQWYKETVSEFQSSDEAPQQPALQCLKQAMDEFKIHRSWMKRLVDGRIRELTPPKTMEEMEEQVESVHSSLLYAHLQLLGVQSTEADHTASHLGKADGLTRAIFGAPFAASRGRSTIPAQVRRKHGLSDADATKPPNGPDSPAANAYFEIASTAWVHLERARKGSVPKEALPAFINASVVEWRLERLRKAHFDPFQSVLHHPGNRFHIGFQLAKARLLRRF